MRYSFDLIMVFINILKTRPIPFVQSHFVSFLSKQIKLPIFKMRALFFNNVKTVFFILISLTYLNVNGQVLTFLEVEIDGFSGVDGLNGSYGVVISNDDKFVYTASSTDDAVSVFARNSVTGNLTYITQYVDDGNGGTIDGLSNAKRLCISPDDNFIYVPTSSDDAIVCFSRNTATGLLTYVQTIKDGVGGVDGLNGAHQCIVSPSNNFLYVVGYIDDMVSVFSRNVVTGVLTYVQSYQDGVGGIDGLNTARGLSIAPNGTTLYVASATDDAVAVFSCDLVTGLLTYQENHKDGVAGIDGLNGCYSIDVSPDGKHLYTAAYNDDAVTVFSIDAGTGLLTYVENHKNMSQAGGHIPGLNSARHALVSPDNSFVFVQSSSDHTISTFSRNTITGSLTFVEEEVDGVAGVNGLNGGRFLAASSDNKSVFSVSAGDDALAVFDRTNIILAISLVSFEAAIINDEVALSWSTSSELSSSHFVIERSENGTYFQALGEVNAVGNSVSLNQYKFKDASPLKGVGFYRIKMIDQDGGWNYSQIQQISNYSDYRLIRSYPNPVNRGEILSIENASTRGNLYSIHGSLVSSPIDYLETKIEIETVTLSSGIYIWVEGSQRLKIIVE